MFFSRKITVCGLNMAMVLNVKEKKHSVCRAMGIIHMLHAYRGSSKH